jgi:hypothetical protein
MKNKKISTYDVYKSIRRTWDINPKTRVKDSDKKFNRAKSNQELRKQIKGDLDG